MAVKPTKHVAPTETYGQMQKRINSMGTPIEPNGDHQTYINKNGKIVGRYDRIGEELGGTVKLNDGKKTCVATNFRKQMEYNSQNYVPIVFDYCYADQKK